MLWLLFISLLSSLMADNEHQGPLPCGGRLKGPYGVIHTPNFPNAFPVPIKCKWIIEHDITNGTISIYFTQQYTTSGLTFTEYMYYDDTYKLGERRALTVTEENITRIKWLQVQSPVLVVELMLSALEGTQLRALGLLSVYGLNVTYAIRAPAQRAPAQLDAIHAVPANTCSALECRLLGHCLASHDYQQFYCACFDGYSGADCGEGPLCSTYMCKHGGLCRQMGPAAVSCICAPGYTGDLCETRISPPECGIDECSEGCKDGTACDCNPRDSDSTTARFETKLQVKDQPNVNISQELSRQLTTFFKASNITLDEDIEILNVSSIDKNGARAVSMRLWAARRLATSIRSALQRLAAQDNRRNPRVTLLPITPHFEMQPALSLRALTVNQRSEVWEGSEFILSCTAYGSPDILFTWYKDGIKINFNGTTRDVWTRTVAEDAFGRRISVLGVSEAHQVDKGRWSCAADDAGRRRCRALWLTVLRPPDIRLSPSALTVNKGDNVSITCLAAGASRVHGALGFSWARERILLPLVPGREVWEDLYPAGSVLKLYNVQKSGEYRCQVSSVAGTNAKAVIMWALGPLDEACETSPSHGIRWPRTAPGAHASAACPPGHSGETTRFCEPRTLQSGIRWRLPDFSGCVADPLKYIFEQFLLISYGYKWMDVTNIVHQYDAVIRSIPAHPGEGTIPLQHIKEILRYLLSPAAKPKDREDSVHYLLKIYDMLLKHPDAFLDEEKTYELQNALAETVGMRANIEEHFHEFSVMSKPVQENGAAHFRIQKKNSRNEEWLVASAGVELIEQHKNVSIVVVQYNNLASRLPSLRSAIENKDGREIEYLLASPQVQLSASGSAVDKSLQHSILLLFTHIYNYSAIASKLACGLRSSSEPGVWSTKACELRIPEQKYVTCKCRGLGTYALFTVARSTLTEAEKDLRGVVQITASIGGSMCLAVAALQLLGLITSRVSKLPIFLKVATAGTHSAAMFAILECDARQEAACPGVLGWICAICWCAGCATLCAQPLLLQQELAGRTQNAPSVGLLAGVCILCWLSARLWGGLPLQLGAAAQVVCAAGCALLLILCFALAVCGGLNLRTITKKVPIERRNYFKDRQRVVRHTLMLLTTTTAVQVAGITYVQPGNRQTSHVVLLAAAAIINGIAMVVCYVICDDECMFAARRALFLAPNREWEKDSPAGETSLSLYIKQGGEVESRGGAGVLDSSSSQVSPITSYWNTNGLENAVSIHRRQSTSDSRADIVRCVEYADCASRHNAHHMGHLGTTRALCDLVPRAPSVPPEHLARIRRELGTPSMMSPLSYSSQPHVEHCTLCTRSTPDVSIEQPIKSCLKKSNMNQEFSSSISLPSIDVTKEDLKKSDIEHVNREWNKAYESPDTEKVLNKISSDLHFLLGKAVVSNTALDQIQEAPT